MSSQVYITDIVNVTMPSFTTREPRERFINYYADLHRLYQSQLDHETFHQGSQFSFAEIGEKIFEIIFNKHTVLEVDILILAHWAHEFDPEYSNCVPYLAEKFQLNCDFFDVHDQGVVASFTGLHILQHYLCNQNGILLLMEQTTVPRRVEEYPALPTTNGGSAFLLQSVSEISQLKLTNNIGFRVIDSIIFDSSRLHLSKKTNWDFIQDLILQKSLNNKTINIVIRKNSLTWRQIQSNHVNMNFEFYTFSHITPEPSILSISDYLYKILNKKIESKTNYLFIIDEDVETLNVGALFLEIINLSS